MMRPAATLRRRLLGLLGVSLALLLPRCATAPSTDLASSLQGIDQASFLRCSGPPIVSFNDAGRQRMSFITNLRRGEVIGVTSPTALPPASCSVDAVFLDDRLLNARFSGDLTMCNFVFAACRKR